MFANKNTERELWHTSMEIVDVDLVRPEFLQALVDNLLDLLRLVRSRLARIPLAGNRQAPLLVPGVRRPGLLLASHIDSSRIDLVVPLRLKVVEVFLVLVKRGDPSSGRFIGTKRHAGGEGSAGMNLCQILTS
jgi:hypothetical protein